MPLLCGASVAEVSKYDGAVHLESNKQKMLMGVFFTQSMRVKLALPQAAWLSIFLYENY